MMLTYFLIFVMIGIIITQKAPALTPQQIGNIKITMQKECSKCKMCETQNNSIHPCDSPLCSGTMLNVGPCKMCSQYPSCYMCKSMCLLLPMISQIPPSFGKWYCHILLLCCIHWIHYLFIMSVYDKYKLYYFFYNLDVIILCINDTQQYTNITMDKKDL